MNKQDRVKLSVDLILRSHKELLELLRFRLNSLSILFGSTITAMLVILPTFHHLKDGPIILVTLSFLFLAISAEPIFELLNKNLLAGIEYIRLINKYNGMLVAESKKEVHEAIKDKDRGITDLRGFLKKEEKFFNYYIPSISVYLCAFLLEMYIYL
jgi:hypothetical protein